MHICHVSPFAFCDYFPFFLKAMYFCQSGKEFKLKIYSYFPLKKTGTKGAQNLGLLRV